MSRAALRRAAGVAVIAALVALPAASGRLASGAASACTGVRPRPDGWAAIPPPVGFAASGIVRYAVGSPDGRTLFASDGRTVARSDTAGCSWTPVLVGDVVEVPGVVEVELQRVVDLDVAGDQVYVAAELAVGDVRRTSVLVSRDGGQTWDPGGLGLPVLGDDADLTVSPADADVAYVAVDAPVDGHGVYATADGGRSWTRRTPLLDSADGIRRLHAEPTAPDQVLAYGDAGLMRSGDGGATFAPLPGAAFGVADLGVVSAGPSVRIVAADPDVPAVRRSDDGGRTWRYVPSPMTPHSVATTSAVDVVAVSGEGRVALIVGTDALDATPESASVTDLHLGATSYGLRLVGRSGTGLLRRDFPVRAQAALPRVELRARRVATRAASLAPAHTDLMLAAGTSRTVSYDLDLPPTPTPLDVVFVVDTTGSMGGVIAGLRRGLQQIVDEIAAAGIDAQFGVAEFKEYPIAPWGSAPDVPYRRLRAVGPVDDGLEDAIEALEASGGGDVPESALTALHQSASGAGDAAGGVAPGLDARFRPGALRVVVTVTDARFHREPGYPGPTLPQAAAALRGRDVRQVGLAVHGGGRGDLVEMATATGAFAPSRGVDCNGDGRVDVAPGAPLVCDVGSSNLLGVVDNTIVDLGRAEVTIAPAVVALVRSVRDTASVELQSQRPDLGRVVGRTVFDGVDAKRPQRLPYLVRYSCPARPRGSDPQRAVVPLRAVRRDAVLATATTRLTCVPLPLPAPPPPDDVLPPRVLLALPALVAVPPPPPPPAPVSNAQPNPNPNPQANPNPQPQPQPGVAVAEQERLEVVAAGAGEDDRQGEEELAMSARSTADDDTAAATALAFAAVAVAATTTAVALRRRVVPVRVRR